MHGIINQMYENKKNYLLLLLTSQKRLIMSLGTILWNKLLKY